MTETAADRVRALRKTRQVREFTDEPVAREDLDALANVARWTGSSRNTQPWRFIVVTDRDALRRMHDLGLPQTRSLKTATAAIAIVLPVAEDERHEIGIAYDDGRAAERILIAAGMLDLGAGIAWVRSDVREPIGEILGLPTGRYVRTIVSLGHPSEAALEPKAAPGEARVPREASIFQERWPAG
ncbi:MAG TPA: nitroreductase family protein [Candidatus Limnocylindrales bacterium]|nr:nitroreductase family protein [Candidatus Limnocylindrales bacterium]